MVLAKLKRRARTALRGKPEAPVTLDRFLAMPQPHATCPICATGRLAHMSAYPSQDRYFRLATVCFCDHCGTGHVPDAKSLIDGYYVSNFSTHNSPDRSLDPALYFSPENEAKFDKYFGRAREQTQALARMGATFGDVLDYGSGPGYWLRVSGGENLFAVELDEASHKYLDYLGATRLDEDAVPPASFDVIVSSHVFEHFDGQVAHAKAQMLYDALKPGGLMLIEVPQGGHSFLRIASPQAPHTIFYTPHGLRSLLERTGGEIADAYCRGTIDTPSALNPVYTPPAGDAFAATSAGGVTVVVRKPA